MTRPRLPDAPAPGNHPYQVAELFRDYNAVGLTAVCERDCYPEQIPIYEGLRESGRSTVRVALSYHISSEGDLPAIQAKIRHVAEEPLFCVVKGTGTVLEHLDEYKKVVMSKK